MKDLRGLLYRIHNFLHNKHVSILWNSQRKRFKSIGNGSSALELPYIIGYDYIIIGDNFHIGKDVRIEARDKYGKQQFHPSIVIGNNVTFTGRCYLSCVDKIKIGNGVLLGRDVFITDNTHGDSSEAVLGVEPISRQLKSKGPVIIGDNVWIGRQVTVLPGVTIGENSIIGANSLVNKDVPPNCVAAGNPANVKKILTKQGVD